MKPLGRAGTLAAAAVAGAALGLLHSRPRRPAPGPRPRLNPSDFEQAGPGLCIRRAVAVRFFGDRARRPVFEGLHDAAAYYQNDFDVRPMLDADRAGGGAVGARVSVSKSNFAVEDGVSEDGSFVQQLYFNPQDKGRLAFAAGMRPRAFTDWDSAAAALRNMERKWQAAHPGFTVDLGALHG